MPDHYYEKYDTDKKRWDSAPLNDLDGKITGKCVLNLKAWFDENPERRIELGYIKHITHTTEEINQNLNWNRQTQMLQNSIKQIDEHTVENEYRVIDKPDELLDLEELTGNEYSSSTGGLIMMWG